MKKIVFVDIDGTIIDSTHGMLKVSDKTRYAFNELKKENLVFISSGRSEGMISDDIKSLKPSGYILNNGGCCVMDGKAIFEVFANKDDMRSLIDYIIENDANFFLEDRYSLRVKDKDDEAMLDFACDWGIDGIVCDKPVKDEQFYMAMALFKDVQGLENFKEAFKDRFDIRNHHGYISCDVNTYGVNKGSGVREVLRYLNIDKQDSYAFGDELNDLEMMMEVGHPIAMGNGNPKLKELAEEVTDQAMEDGFYNYLVRHNLVSPIED